MEKQVPSTPNPEISRGVYGFVMSMGFFLLILLYFLWLIIPTSTTKTWTYEPPQKYWALAVPIFSTTALFLFAFCIYPAMHSRHDGELYEENAFRDKYTIKNGQITYEIPIYSDDDDGTFLQSSARRGKDKKTKKNKIVGQDKSNIVFSNFKLYDENNLHVKSLSKRKIQSASDLDVSKVCKILYLKK